MILTSEDYIFKLDIAGDLYNISEYINHIRVVKYDYHRLDIPVLYKIYLETDNMWLLDNIILTDNYIIVYNEYGEYILDGPIFGVDICY